MFIQAQAELQDYWDVSRESQDLATSIVLVNLSLCKPIGNSIGKNKCSAQKQYFVCHGIVIVLTDDLSPGGGKLLLMGNAERADCCCFGIVQLVGS